VVVSCAVTVANVDLFAVAVIGDNVVPFTPAEHLVPDDDGLVSWSPEVQASTAYKSVGTVTPSGTQIAKPVVLTIPLVDRSGVDLGRHGQGDAATTCRIYLCVLSRQGALDANLTTADTADVFEGRRIISTRTLAQTAINPGPYHRWMLVDQTADIDISPDSTLWFPRWFGVVQLRMEEFSAPPGDKAILVLHPPIGTHAINTISGGWTLQGYTCGILALRSITIQEVGL
jgi:hypothetical protein